MSDLALRWTDLDGSADLELLAGALRTGEDLRTAIIVSLFTDAAAPEGARLPDPADDDRRGWWGDALAIEPGDVTGSTLWLLARAKQVPATLRHADDAASAALAWLVADGVADRVDVVANFPSVGWLALDIEVTRAGHVQRFEFAWSALGERS